MSWIVMQPIFARFLHALFLSIWDNYQGFETKTITLRYAQEE